MSHLKQAIDQLRIEIQSASSDAMRVEVPVGDISTSNAIAWMGAQPLYPKFYWHTRDATEEVVALGQVRTFSDINPAYSVVGENQRIWGGYSFPYTKAPNRCLSSFFFLPQFELLRRQSDWFLAVNFNEDRDTLLSCLDKLGHDFAPRKALVPTIMKVQHRPNKAHWKDMVDYALETIGSTELKKVVLARQSTIKLASPIQGHELLALSCEQNRSNFHFLFQMDAGHAFIGSTPERLYCRHGQLLETEALAGTIGRDEKPEEDLKLARWLMQDRKNLIENQYVVDDIVERLTPFCDEIEVEESPRLIRLRRVQHLKRHIQAELARDVDKSQLLQALQPTAAVAGLPRKLALEFIEQHEPFSRSWYSGSLGYISEKSAEFCVAIRSAFIQKDNMHLFAGAGIVPGSEAEYEWQELDKKMSTLLSLVAEQSVLEQAS